MEKIKTLTETNARSVENSVNKQKQGGKKITGTDYE